MEKRDRIRLCRVILPVLGLVLALSALVLYRHYAQVPKTLAEYYASLYPRNRYAEYNERIRYDYPMLQKMAKTVLIVTPEGDLTPERGRATPGTRTTRGRTCG